MNDLEKKYDNKTSAEALFSTNQDGIPKSFRFEIISKGWELSDGDRIGKVVDGTFYFNGDLDTILRTNTRGGYYVDVVRGDVVYSLITFYKQGSTVDKLGEFYAKDPRKVVSTSGLYQQKGRSGLWQKTNYAHSTATVNKSASSTEFTLNCPSLKKKATFHCNQETDKKLYESVVQNVEGNLVVKDINKINEATTVKWTPRDLVFYPNTQLKALSGFFYGKHTCIDVEIYWSLDPVEGNNPNRLGEDDTDREEIELKNVIWG